MNRPSFSNPLLFLKPLLFSMIAVGLFLRSGSIHAQSVPGVLQYPTSFDTALSLFQAQDNSQTTLTASVLPSDTTIQVASTASFPPSGALVIDSEILYYTSTTATLFSGLLRGQDGSVAAGHSSGATVSGPILNIFHSTLALAILNLQAKLGIGASSPVPGSVLAGTGAGSSAFTTDPSLGGDLAVGGNATITGSLSAGGIGITGNASVTGTLTAGKVVGNGSGLTGVTASGLLSSGPTVINSSTGAVSIEANGNSGFRQNIDGTVDFLAGLGLATKQSLFGNVVDVKRDYGAKGDGVTNDEPSIQAALDGMAAAGGGDVYLPKGIYYIQSPLVVGSDVKLSGAGIGSTIVRPSGLLSGKIIDGAGVYGAIATVGSVGSTIADLTVDLATNSSVDNGITLLPNGSGYSGTPSANCTVENTQVLGAGQYHAYMIWNFKGYHTKIINNFVNGNSTNFLAASLQEGIESYGGMDVLISGNTVCNMGQNGINLASAGGNNTSLLGATITNNYIYDTNNGVSVYPSYDSVYGPQNILNLHITNNIFKHLRWRGIYVAVYANTSIQDLQITGNSIEDIGPNSSDAACGIFFQGDPLSEGQSPSLTSVLSNIVSGNTIENIHGNNASGISLFSYPGVHIINNTIGEIDHSGVVCLNSNNMDIDGNKIFETYYYTMWIDNNSSQITIKDNVVSNWNSSHQGAAGIFVNNANIATVTGNVFQQPDSVSETPALNITTNASSVYTGGNTILYPSTISYYFLNLGHNLDYGTFNAIQGQNAIIVHNVLVKRNSFISINQTAGNPSKFTVSPSNGQFIVTLPAPSANGNEAFKYKIDN